MGIKLFKEIEEKDSVGGKGKSLAKMYQNGFDIPNGYVITADVFDEFLKENNAKEEVNKLLSQANINDEKKLEEISQNIIQIISNCEVSDDIEDEIIEKYEFLNCDYVAVRSSATSEDGMEHAWAGQLETFLNATDKNIIECVKKCWASVFTPRAIFYKLKTKKELDISVAVVVQEMVESDISGVAFSINPTTNEDNEIIIEAVLGLGEAIVSGEVTPDTYIVNKNENVIESKEISVQTKEIRKVNEINKWNHIDNKEQKLSDEKILEIADNVKEIEEFYGFSVDIEWGIEDDELFILQCRPITTVNKNLESKIKNSGDWKFYVSRKFNWFVENTEIYSTMENYQKELLGFVFPTLNYLCLNGDEYALESDFEATSHRLNTYFDDDEDFFEKFAQIEFELVDDIQRYIEYLKIKNLEGLSLEELKIEFEKFNLMYIKSFIPGMTRPEDFLIDRLEKELEMENFNKEDIEKIFERISTCPSYYPLSYSEEPLDLLKLALKIKNGEVIDGLLEKHIEKYAWIKGPVEFEDTCFTKEDYLERLENIDKDLIEEKIKNIYSVREENENVYLDTLDEYIFNSRIKKLVKAIRNFIFLRTYTTEFSDHLFYMGRHTIFEEISKRTDISVPDLIMLSDKEIIDILSNDGVMNPEIEEMLANRKVGFAMIWLNGNVTTVFGEESLKLQKKIGAMFKKANKNEKSNSKVVIGNVANRGKVKGIARILNKYEDIYKVKKGDIIVATMTTPDYVSAMEKAAGFITDEGGITCHAAILSREFDVPCIVGTINGTKQIKDGQKIELDGYSGNVYILD